MTPGLTPSDRRLAALAHARSCALLDDLDASTGLHCEPHEDNVVWTERGPLLIDFEAVCAGPVEWDLAYLPDAALIAFPNRDVAALARLPAAVSYSVAAWCSAQPGRAPEVAAAAQCHLDAVRHSWRAE